MNQKIDTLDRLNWLSLNLRIIDKEGRLVRLYPNIQQIRLNNTVELQRSLGLPVRVVILKARQIGMSTWVEGLGFCDVYHKGNWSALAVSKDTDSTDTIFRMAKLFQEEVPVKLATDNSNRKEIIFSRPHRSRFMSQTAGKIGVGRSEKINFLHCSEVAFWEQAARQLAGLYQVVPNKKDTCIFLESTANGVGGAFYDTFWNAVEHRRKHKDDYRGYLPVFFPWYKFAEYQIDTKGSGFIPDSQEKALAKEFGLSPAQLYWRRLKLEELNYDESLFKQEYPATALEAFQASGNPVFTQKMINEQLARVAGSPRRLIFEKDCLRDVDWSFNCWQMCRPVQKGHQYCIGADTMEGRVSDVKDEKSKLDCDGVLVLDRTAGEVVAIYHGRGDQGQLGLQVYYAGLYYNEAWVAPEIPAGMTLLKVLKDKGYPNIYNRQIHDQRLDVEEGEELGWRTTNITRGWLISDILVAMRDMSILVRFESIIDEMRTFIRNKVGNAVHMPGKHDDLLFALMIALQVHIRCPLAPSPYPDGYTGNTKSWRDEEKSLSYVGAVDSGIEEDEDEYESHTY